MLRDCRPLIDMLGDRFVLAYTAVKESGRDTFLQVISSWEREHLLLNVSEVTGGQSLSDSNWRWLFLLD